MAASDTVGRESPRPALTLAAPGRLRSASLLAVAAGVLLWFFPLCRIVPLAPANPTAGPAAFDPAAAAAKAWHHELPAAAGRAVDLGTLAGRLREDPAGAARQFAHAAGLGAAYYFVRGSGRIVARDRNHLYLEVAGATPALVAVRIGPIFGNTLRDGCGLFDVNAFPGLMEFNALSAELNALAEKTVLPTLKDQAIVGATLQFAGCAEAPDTVAEPGAPLLTVIPVQADVR